MSITVLPTKAIGSLGPVKTDIRAYLRPTSELPAVELEAIKQAIIDLATEVGLTDGTTAGSLREFATVDRAKFTYFDDFLRLDDGPEGAWDTAVVGTGAITHLAANGVAIQGQAIGGVDLGVDVTLDTAALASDTEWVDPAANPIFEARVRLAATISNLDFDIGFQSIAGTSRTRFTHVNGSWRAESVSLTGASSDALNTVVDLVANAWVTLRIEIDSGAEARFYVDGTLIATLSVAAGIPTAGDALRPRFWVGHLASTGGRMFVDWVEVRGSR